LPKTGWDKRVSFNLQMKLRVVSLLLAAPHSLATRRLFVSHRSHGLQQGLISPKLDPESDKVFFGNDYPDNQTPKGQLKPEFKHPYPSLQDWDHYDKDYVKDENVDNGEWKAQMDYDLLRTKVTKDKDELEKLKTAEKALQEDLEKARADEVAAAKKAEEASDRAAKARADAKKAQEEAAAAKGATEKAAEAERGSGEKQSAETQAAGNKEKTEDNVASTAGGEEKKAASGTDNSKVQEATDKVKKEMSDLEKCQQELADARARLKELMKKEDELARKRTEQKELEKARHEAKVAKLAKEEAAAATALSEREKESRTLLEEEKLNEDRLSKEEAAHQVAEQQYKAKATDLDKMESDLKAAEKTLQTYRRGEDAKGGLHNSEKPAERTNLLGSKSGSTQQGIYIAFIALIVATFM